MKCAIALAATLCIALNSGCAVAPAAAPICTTVPATQSVSSPATASSATAFATAPAVPTVVARTSYVRPVIPPLPAELVQPSTRRAESLKSITYSADLLAAMVVAVPDADVFLAGGDTYFWHKDPRGHRERVFYGHGDRRGEIAQRRSGADSRLAETSRSKS